MSLSVTIGGATRTFEAETGREVACLLDNAFGAEGEWEEAAPRCFGELTADGWAEFRSRALADLGIDDAPNLASVRNDARGVFLPANVRAVELPLSRGGPLRCASLPGLRAELTLLAERWELPTDDEGLHGLLGEDDSDMLDAPEVSAFARLALAANEALRRDCPLWLVGM